MAKFIVLYYEPKDKDGFEKYYHDVHIPLAKDMPHVEKVTIHRVLQTQNAEKDYYLMVEIVYPDLATLNQSLSSEAGKRVQEDAKNLAPFLNEPPQILITE